MKWDSVIQSKNFKNALWCIIAIAALAVAFAGGVFVGLEKARFSYAWGEHYSPAFAAPPPFSDQGYMASHGSMGTIKSITPTSFTLENTQGAQQTILLDSQTVFRKSTSTIASTALHTGDTVVVIGSPGNQGQLKASFVRVTSGS